jgi:site-specific DNA recombinase
MRVYSVSSGGDSPSGPPRKRSQRTERLKVSVWAFGYTRYLTERRKSALLPVLGYDVDPSGGRLVVNEEEAERVRAIFALFEESRSIVLTLAEIERRGWRLKSWTRKAGRFRAGGPFAINSLRRLLTNVLYTGAIRHKGQQYPGEHAAVLAPGTWERVQHLITHPAELAHGRSRNKHLALLGGLLYRESCAARMVYSHARKNDRRYP